MTRGEKIRFLRKAKGWKQGVLVRRLRGKAGGFTSISNLSKIEGGAADREPTRVLEAIATALEVPPDALLTSRLDDAIDEDIDKFVTAASLEALIVSARIPEAVAQPIRDAYEKIQRGPKDADGWKVLLVYAYFYAHGAIRRPGAKIELPASLLRDVRPGRVG